MSAAGSVVSYQQQGAAAKAQSRYQYQNMVLEQKRALAEQSQIRTKQAVEAESTSLELAKVSKEARKQRSSAATIAGESGITGPSVDMLLNDYAAQEAAIYSQSQRQAQLDNIYTEQQLAASRLGSISNINRMNEPVSRPSALALALSIGSSALNSYSSYKNWTGGFTKPTGKR